MKRPIHARKRSCPKQSRANQLTGLISYHLRLFFNLLHQISGVKWKIGTFRLRPSAGGRQYPQRVDNWLAANLSAIELCAECMNCETINNNQKEAAFGG